MGPAIMITAGMLSEVSIKIKWGCPRNSPSKHYVFSILLFLFQSALTCVHHIVSSRDLREFVTIVTLFFKDFIYLFLERGEGREKERGKNINVWLPLKHPLLETWPATQACALTGNRTGDPLVHRPALKSTEPHQPGLL